MHAVSGAFSCFWSTHIAGWCCWMHALDRIVSKLLFTNKVDKCKGKHVVDRAISSYWSADIADWRRWIHAVCRVVHIFWSADIADWRG